MTKYPVLAWIEHPFYKNVAKAEIWYSQQFQYIADKNNDRSVKPLSTHELTPDLVNCTWETLVTFFPPPKGYKWSGHVNTGTKS